MLKVGERGKKCQRGIEREPYVHSHDSNIGTFILLLNNREREREKCLMFFVCIGIER